MVCTWSTRLRPFCCLICNLGDTFFVSTGVRVLELLAIRMPPSKVNKWASYKESTGTSQLPSNEASKTFDLHPPLRRLLSEEIFNAFLNS